ncbi:MAG: hypothetical protein KTR21_11995 [Rhodobacteraceae bacterium]|nr:hypothetical protein [Paracoccaceae bacterium]
MSRVSTSILTAGLLVAMVTGCGRAELTESYNLPESPEVENEPWPRLIDAPAPISTTGENPLAEIIGKGDQINDELSADAAALLERDAAAAAEAPNTVVVTPQPVDPALAARAERLRARAKALHAQE